MHSICLDTLIVTLFSQCNQDKELQKPLKRNRLKIKKTKKLIFIFRIFVLNSFPDIIQALLQY